MLAEDPELNPPRVTQPVGGSRGWHPPHKPAVLPELEKKLFSPEFKACAWVRTGIFFLAKARTPASFWLLVVFAAEFKDCNNY